MQRLVLVYLNGLPHVYPLGFHDRFGFAPVDGVMRVRFGGNVNTTARCAWAMNASDSSVESDGASPSGSPTAAPLEQQCAIQSYTATEIVCLMPPSVGAGFQVFIRQSWTDLPSTAGYAQPRVDSIAPSLLGIGGGVITITGGNFGLGVCEDERRRSAVQVRCLHCRGAVFALSRCGVCVVADIRRTISSD